VLEVKTLDKSYSFSTIPFRKKRIKVLDNISFRINKHETLCIVGESGCGKTTLAKCIVNLENPDNGKIILEGRDVTFPDRKTLYYLHTKVQMIFQNADTSLNPRHHIYDSLAEPLRLQGQNEDKVRKRVFQLLDHVGLSEEHLHRHPHQLSGGQNQRIAIARAIALHPDLLIADEITAALDVSVQAQILQLLKTLKKEMDMTLLFISHDLALVKRIADRVAVMQDGKLVEINDTNEIFHNPQSPYTKELIASMSKLSLNSHSPK